MQSKLDCTNCLIMPVINFRDVGAAGTLLHAACKNVSHVLSLLPNHYGNFRTNVVYLR
jgi:hypothetical protein